MLFDLRGTGRRRTVKVIYASLAILMGGSLVLLGVGSDTQGGLLDAFKDDNQSGSDGTKELRQRIDRLEERVLAQPKAANSWAELARLRFQVANQDGVDEDVLEQTGQAVYNDAGKRRLREAGQAWQRYLALDPKVPDVRIASLMVQAYAGLEQYSDGVAAQEIVIGESGTGTNQQRAAQYRILAILAFQAKQDQKGDLASSRAVALIGKDNAKEFKENLDAQKKAILEARQQENAPAPDPTSATG